MYIELSATRLGLELGPVEAVALAERAGFDAVEPNVLSVLAMKELQLVQLAGFARSCGLAFGTGVLPVEFRHDAATFVAGMRMLPRAARALRAIGCHRLCAYLPSGSDTASYAAQFRVVVERLRQIAEVLEPFNIRLGVKYIGAPATLAWVKHPFARSVRHVRDVVRATARSNVGIAFDAWHWYTGGDDLRDLGGLQPEELVVVDLADAPPGVPRYAQQLADSLLPGTTRVIDNVGLIALLQRIGYMGPVRVEAYGHGLRRVAKFAAVETVAAALGNFVRPHARGGNDDDQDTFLYRTLCA
jgi:sugar phosphate isomerase/epimerase